MQKAFDLGGQIKLGHFLFDENEKAELYRLKYLPQEKMAGGLADQVQMQLWGNHAWKRIQFSWKINGSAQKGDSSLESKEKNKIEEAGITWQPIPELRWYAGKKVLSWGKGHGWTPLAFLDPHRDPLDPDMPHTGLIFLGTEYEREFPPSPDPLQALTFTSLIFPVQEKVNEGFGHLNNWNMAGKLSLLFWNTELDWVVLKGKSRPEHYGFDFSRKVNSFLEIYGDFWTSPLYEKVFLDQSGELWKTEYTAFGSLQGLRYERWGMCCTVEYYRNKAGFNPEEMSTYYNYLQTVVDAYPKEGGTEARKRIMILSNAYYQHPNPMQEYAYTQILKRAPLGVQHLTCSIAGVWNIQDRSYALCPEIRYNSKPNLNIGLKNTFWQGNPHTEFGEQIKHWSVEISLTYSFESSFSATPSYSAEPYQYQKEPHLEESQPEPPPHEEPYLDESQPETPPYEEPYLDESEPETPPYEESLPEEPDQGSTGTLR